jgi:hypothetical protein
MRRSVRAREGEGKGNPAFECKRDARLTRAPHSSFKLSIYSERRVYYGLSPIIIENNTSYAFTLKRISLDASRGVLAVTTVGSELGQHLLVRVIGDKRLVHSTASEMKVCRRGLMILTTIMTVGSQLYER